MPKYIEISLYILLGFIIVFSVANILWSRTLASTSTALNNPNTTLGTYYLPKSIFVLSVRTVVLVEVDSSGKISSTKISNQNFRISQEIIGDWSKPLFLNYHHNPFSNEEIEFQVNEKGLIENFKGESDNRLEQIIFSLTSFDSEVLKGRQSFSTHSFFRSSKKIRIIEQVFEEEFKISPNEIIGKSKTINWKPKVFSDEDIDSSKIVDASITISANKAASNSSQNNKGTKTETWEGIVFSLHENISINVQGKGGLGQKEIELSYLDSSSVYSVPVRTTPFARRKHLMSIKDGQLIDHKLTNPSSVEGFSRIPVQIGKAIFSIPSELISLHIGTNKKLTELKRSEIENKKNLLKAEKDLLLAKKDLYQTHAYLEEFRNDSKTEIDKLNQIIQDLESKN